MEARRDIWSDLGGRIRAFVGSRVNDTHAADDITQDVLLKVQAKPGAVPAEDKRSAWVFSIARNAVIDHYRTRAVRNRDAIGDAEPRADTTDPRTEDEVRKLTACLGRMIEQLPEPYRNAMKLVDLDGLSQQQLADRSGISLSGAKSRVQRARQELKDMLLDCCVVERDARGNVIDFQRTERSARYFGGDDGTAKCDD
jgi:RNA polymerase sigma-70 factor (ECF subfamily)